MTILIQMRWLFVAYVVVRVVVEISLLGYLGEEVQQLLERIGFPALADHVHVVLLISVIFNAGVHIALGMLVFHFLLLKRNGARILLLVVAWLVVIDAVAGYLFTPHLTNLLSRFDSSLEWWRMIFLDRTTDILGFIYFAYVIYRLQFDENVQRLFLPAPEPQPQESQ